MTMDDRERKLEEVVDALDAPLAEIGDLLGQLGALGENATDDTIGALLAKLGSAVGQSEEIVGRLNE